jgi:hypothetical protein
MRHSAYIHGSIRQIMRLRSNAENPQTESNRNRWRISTEVAQQATQERIQMTKPLSQQLSELSVHAKNAEDAAATAQQEAHAKAAALRDQARAAASAATEKVNQEAKGAKDRASRNWNALQAKIAADVNSLKTVVAARKREIDAERAETTAERLEWEAAFSIDYAIASIEQAKYAVLDAIVGRVEAQDAKRAAV